jgi:hypothetical protein
MDRRRGHLRRHDSLGWGEIRDLLAAANLTREETYMRKRFNSPNDVVVKKDDSI